MAHLFEPLKLRDIVLANRIGIPPMCQYSARDGMASDWHFVHYGSRAVGGAALMIIEATAVTPEGRISAGDLGLWDDKQIEPLARIAQFDGQQGCAAAVQLAHAGRKASVGLGWQAQKTLATGEGGWTVVAPTAVPFGEGYALPHELDAEGISHVIARFAAAARRARSRLSGGGDTRGTRLPAAPVPVAAVQPAQGCIRRQLREPYPAGKGSGESSS